MIDTIIQLFSENPIAQTIGLFGFIASFATFVSLKDKTFIILMIVVSILWGIHFHMLGLLSAAYINYFDILKNALALKYKKNNYITGIIIFVYIVIGFYTFTGTLISLFPVFCAILGTIILYYLHGVHMRMGFMLILLLWFTYNSTGGSIGGVMSDTLLFGAGLIGITRILLHKKKETDIKEIPDN